MSKNFFILLLAFWLVACSPAPTTQTAVPLGKAGAQETTPSATFVPTATPMPTATATAVATEVPPSPTPTESGPKEGDLHGEYIYHILKDSNGKEILQDDFRSVGQTFMFDEKGLPPILFVNGNTAQNIIPVSYFAAKSLPGETTIKEISHPENTPGKQTGYDGTILNPLLYIAAENKIYPDGMDTNGTEASQLFFTKLNDNSLVKPISDGKTSVEW